MAAETPATTTWIGQPLRRPEDPGAARALPGVHAVLTGQDLPRDLAPQPVFIHFQDERPTPTWALARDRVRDVGEPVAVVAADSAGLAEDAGERIVVEWEPLPAVVDPEAALAPAAVTPDRILAAVGAAAAQRDAAGAR